MRERCTALCVGAFLLFAGCAQTVDTAAETQALLETDRGLREHIRPLAFGASSWSAYSEVLPGRARIISLAREAGYPTYSARAFPLPKEQWTPCSSFGNRFPNGMT